MTKERHKTICFATPLTKPNKHVKRAQRTHTDEFYEVANKGFEIAELHQALSECERDYNAVGARGALGYLSPKEFLNLRRENKKGVCCCQAKMSP
jgi:hypothetical protein